MKVLHRIFAFLLVPILGYLLGATIFNFFYDKAEPGDLSKATVVATAKSCERHGPVALRGFGFYYKCKIELKAKSGTTSTSTVTGWLDPSDIGKQYAAHTQRRSEVQPDERSQIFLGWLFTFIYGIFFLGVWAKIAGPVLPGQDPRGRRMPKKYEPPTTT